MATLTEQLDRMLTLTPNWDGYNADPIQPRLVELARDFVGEFHSQRGRGGDETGMYVVPGRDGGVLVGWEDDTAEYEMDVYADGAYEFLEEDKFTGVMATERFAPLASGLPAALLLRLPAKVVA